MQVIQDAASTVQTNLDNTKFTAGDSQDLEIYHDGTNSHLRNSTNTFYIRNFCYFDHFLYLLIYFLNSYINTIILKQLKQF